MASIWEQARKTLKDLTSQGLARGQGAQQKLQTQNLQQPKRDIVPFQVQRSQVGKNLDYMTNRVAQPIANYFNPTLSTNQRPGFWSPKNPIATTLSNIQKFNQNPIRFPVQQILSATPQQQPNPVFRTAQNFLAGAADDMANLPQRILQGGNRLGDDLRNTNQGQRYSLPRFIGTAAGVAEPLLDIATLGATTPFKSVAKGIVKKSAQQGFKSAVREGVFKGAGYGAIYGGLRGASEGEEADLLTTLQGIAAGGSIGAVAGGGTAGISSIAGKTFNKIKSILTGKYGMSEAQANSAAKKFARDELGRFTGLEKIPNKFNKAQTEGFKKINLRLGRAVDEPVYADDLRRSLGLPLRGQEQAGFAKFDEFIPKGVKKVIVKPQEQIKSEIKKSLEQPKMKGYTPFGSYTNTRSDQVYNPLPWEINQKTVQGSGKELSFPSQAGGTSQSVGTPATSRHFSTVDSLQAKQKARPVIDSQGGKANTSFDDIVGSSEIDVKEKVAIWDYLRTPDRVLKKMGLDKEADQLRKSYDKYLVELPKEIDKITAWSKQVSGDANGRIFKYLDGQAGENILSKKELVVAGEIKDYLKQWADKLDLPEDGRITSYITHIFDKDFIQKEFDPDIARLIRDRVPGSVYDPFVEQRLGKRGYLEDTWKALDAYVKRATRKVNMDGSLKRIASKADNLEESQFNYIKGYLDRVNMRPTKIDNLLDNTVKQVIGYRLGQRPTTAVTRNLRQMVYRGTLGLNVGSAVRNLTQGANTYAKLGEKYTTVGYYKMAKALISRDGELERVGVLKNDFIQDRTISATKKFWENLDKGLWVFFDLAEKINRGSAYYGGKAKALKAGMSEEQAIEAGKKLVRDTQFSFGSVDTPALLQSDIAKVFGQFQSFNLKQTEFLGEMVKNKEFAGLVRYALSSMAMVYTVGGLIGLEPKDMIPFSGILTGETKLGVTPPIQLGADIVNTVAGGKGKFGEEQDINDRIKTFQKDLVPFIPGGVQLKKTIEGIGAYQQGMSTTPSGEKRYDIEKNPANFIRSAVFGQYSLPGAREYFENQGVSKSKLIYKELVKLKTPEEKAQAWDQMVKEGKITKNNVNDVKKLFKYEALGVTESDVKLISLGVESGDRSRVIANKFKSLKTPEEKAALWEKYVKAKIITKEVAKQLMPLLQQE